jgi:hypothetical protein
MMLGLLLLLQATPGPGAPAPGWKLSDRTNSAGVRSVGTAVTGTDGVSRLIVKCDVAEEPIVSVQFLHPAQIGAGPKPVAVRFDNGLANSFLWEVASAGAYVSDPQAVTTLTTFLARAKTVSVETTNASNFAIQATFPAPGDDRLIRQVLGICGYTLGTLPPAPAPKNAK